MIKRICLIAFALCLTLISIASFAECEWEEKSVTYEIKDDEPIGVYAKNPSTTKIDSNAALYTIEKNGNGIVLKTSADDSGTALSGQAFFPKDADAAQYVQYKDDATYIPVLLEYKTEKSGSTMDSAAPQNQECWVPCSMFKGEDLPDYLTPYEWNTTVPKELIETDKSTTIYALDKVTEYRINTKRKTITISSNPDQKYTEISAYFPAPETDKELLIEKDGSFYIPVQLVYEDGSGRSKVQCLVDRTLFDAAHVANLLKKNSDYLNDTKLKELNNKIIDGLDEKIGTLQTELETKLGNVMDKEDIESLTNNIPENVKDLIFQDIRVIIAAAVLLVLVLLSIAALVFVLIMKSNTEKDFAAVEDRILGALENQQDDIVNRVDEQLKESNSKTQKSLKNTDIVIAKQLKSIHEKLDILLPKEEPDYFAIFMEAYQKAVGQPFNNWLVALAPFHPEFVDYNADKDSFIAEEYQNEPRYAVCAVDNQLYMVPSCFNNLSDTGLKRAFEIDQKNGSKGWLLDAPATVTPDFNCYRLKSKGQITVFRADDE